MSRLAEPRQIIHVDMDAFYASVEVLDNPALKGRPVIVGGTPQQRGVVSAASYEARQYGVHSAMPARTARRLCPHGVFLEPRHERYAQVSRQIHAIFERYTPLVEPLSLDEAFLDVTGSQRLFGPGPQIARALKRAIRDELKLVASVGVAPNKFLAKLASDLQKPDGFVVVPPEGVRPFLAPLPVSRLWGVGQVGQQTLARLNLRTIGQIQQLDQARMTRLLGPWGTLLWELAQGRDPRPVIPDSQAKSLSAETTFARDVADREVLAAWLLEQCEQVGWRLRRQQLLGRTVQIKVRYADFRTITRHASLPEPTDETDAIWTTARRLLQTRVDLDRAAVRLVGVGLAGLVPNTLRQMELLDAGRSARRRRLDRALDAVRGRFGPQAIKRAALLRAETEPAP